MDSLKCLKVDDRAQSTSQLSMAYSSFSAVQRISQDISDVVKVRIVYADVVGLEV